MAESSACLVRSFSSPAETTCYEVSFFFFFGFVISNFYVFFFVALVTENWCYAMFGFWLLRE